MSPATKPRPAPRLVSGLAAAALFAAVASLHGYVLLGPSWPTGSATFRVNPNFPTGAGGTTPQQIEAIRCGASAWRNQGQANINLAYLGTTGITTVNTGDGTNAVFYEPGSGGGATLAVTVYNFNIFDDFTGFDMVFFGSNQFGPIIWNGVGDPPGNQSDLAAVATHEFGHAVGLDHTSVSGAATMWPAYADGDPGPRTLHPDDINGIRAIYGFNASIDPDPQINMVDPPDGPTGGGNAVTILGANFTWETDTVLRIDGASLSPVFWELENCGRITISSMPAHAPGPVPITIENQLGSVTLQNAYEYGGLAPTLASVSPAAGPVTGGNTVNIFGDNLASSAVVVFGSQVATNVTQVSAQQLVVTAPAGPGPNTTVDVIVSQSAGSATLPGAYLYTDSALRLEGVNIPIGGTAVSRALATSGVPLAGFSVAAQFDGTLLDVVSVDAAGTAAAPAEFYETGSANGTGAGASWWNVGCVMSFTQSISLPAGVDVPVAAVTYEMEGFSPPGSAVVLDLANGVGVPPTDNIFVPASGVSISPTLIDGILIGVVGSFIRGDANEDGTVNVADPVSILGFLFTSGPGACPDAMDANDDGGINIADAIYALTFLFASGPPPPPPHPNPGADPTPDPLGC